MAPRDRIYPDSGYPSAPPPPGSYYNVKDQQGIPPPATYRQRPRGRSPCCCCLLWLCSIFTILIVLLGLAVLIFWLVVQPKAPKFEVNTVRIDGLTTPGPLHVNITYQITARNPNKDMGFYYSDIYVKVEADGNMIGNGTVNGFYQGHKNSTVIDGEISSEGLALSSDTQSSLEKDLTDAPFYAEVDLKVKVKVGAIKTGKFKIKVKCNIAVDLSTTQGSQLKSSSCKVKW